MKNIKSISEYFINESNTYRIFGYKSNEPRTVVIEGKPKLWCMLGPLPDNVIDYIIKNSRPVVDYRNGELAIHPMTKEPYIKPISGKNKNSWYFFDETTGNWWTAHERFQGKAVILSPDEWNKIFLLK